MKIYPATVEQIPSPLQITSLLNLGKSIRKSLDIIHSNGYCHLDIKPSNIFATDDIDPSKRYVLGDFGSVAAMGQPAIGVSEAYFPKGEDKQASRSLDYLLLAITLLEKSALWSVSDGNLTREEVVAKINKIEDVELKFFLENLVTVT